jgi:ribosomal protein S7
MKNLKMKKFKSTYLKLLASFIKKGKKTKAKKILNESLFTLNKIFKVPASLLVNKFFCLLTVFVETKIIRVRRSRYIVPFPTTFRRRVYLVIKWLTMTVFENKNRVSLSKKLSLEIFATLKGLNSRVLHLRNINNTKALANRSNAHYRW